MNKTEHRRHPFAPIYDADSRILILGTMPSPATLLVGFYYGHPRNRFWKVIAALVDSKQPTTKEEKTALLLRHGIALWDVIQSCDITGADDSSIANALPNDIPTLLKKTKTNIIFANGGTAQRLYNKFLFEQTGVPIIGLPSTSPANAKITDEKLIELWTEKIKPLLF